MPRFNIHHITKYTYEAPVRDSANKIILFPIKDETQEVLRQHLTISGNPLVDVYKDYYGNEVGAFTYAEPHKELVIDSQLEVISKPKPLPLDNIPVPDQWNQLKEIGRQIAFMDYSRQPAFQGMDDLRSVLDGLSGETVSPFTAMQELNNYVYENFQYIQGVTTVETTLQEIWNLKTGVCQDFAHMLSAMLRVIKIPARYVSGYVCANKNGMRGEGATHAWVEAWLPYYGWLGLDPTNNCIVTDLHVRLAVGRNFTDCSPAKGTYKGTSNQVLEVGVTVSYEDDYLHHGPSAVVMKQQPETKIQENSYRKFLELQELQQQQQQQQQ